MAGLLLDARIIHCNLSAMPSIPSLINRIQNALTAGNGKVPWSGSEGQRQFFLDTLDILRTKGLAFVANTTVLAQLSPEDTVLAVIENVGFFAHKNEPQGSEKPNDVVSSVGGIWRFLGAFGATSSNTFVGDGTTTVFTINHGLNTETPSVTVYDVSAQFPTIMYTGITVAVLNANSIRITFTSAPGASSKKIKISK